MAKYNHPPLHGSCECGAFSFETSHAPAVRFVCHCLFCQDFNGKPFSDVTAFKAPHVTMKGTAALIHKKYRLPPNLNRTRCATCGKPAMETMGAWPLKLVFVPSPNFAEQDLLPPVRLHMFYNRRVADVADNLPKYENYWPSQIAVTKAIMGF